MPDRHGLRRWCLAVVLAGTLAGPAIGGCTLPPAPSKVPNAATATDEEMRAAMQTLKKYDADVQAYVKCLAFEIRQNRVTVEEGARLHNAAVDRLQSAATAFNEQMRIYLGH